MSGFLETTAFFCHGTASNICARPRAPRRVGACSLQRATRLDGAKWDLRPIAILVVSAALFFLNGIDGDGISAHPAASPFLNSPTRCPDSALEPGRPSIRPKSHSDKYTIGVSSGVDEGLADWRVCALAGGRGRRRGRRCTAVRRLEADAVLDRDRDGLQRSERLRSE